MSGSNVNVLPGLAVAAVACAPVAAADLTDLSLESLLQTPISSASKYEQALIDVPAAVSVITRDEIGVYGWRTLGQALASLPGIYLTRDRQYDYLGTRGFGMPGDFNTRVLLTVNGNRVNDTVYDSAALGRAFPIDLDLVERIEFIPGPGGAVYGQNAMFGVINVVTRNGLQVDGWEITGSVQEPQQMQEGRIRWGRRLADGTDLLFALGATRSDGDDLPMEFPGAAPGGGTLRGIARGLDGERDDEASFHIGRGAWTFDSAYGSRRKEDPTGAYFSDPLVPGQYERDDYLLAHLQYQQDVAPAWNLLGRAFTGRESYSALFAFDGASNFSTGISEWYGGELRLLHTGFAAHKLMFGIEAQDNARIDQTAYELPVPQVMLRPRPLPAGQAPLVIARNGYRIGLYVQDEWQLSERFSTSLGLRVDNNDNTATRLSPRAALIWHAAPMLTLKTLYGRANRAPNGYERDYDDGTSLVANPRLERERIDTFELIADVQVMPALNLRASAYRWHMHDPIVLGTEAVRGVPQYASGGRVEASGAELSANAQWDGGKRLRVSLSWQDAAFAAGGAPSNSPERLARLNYTQPLGANHDLGLELQYDGERRTVDGSMLRGYWLTNVNLVAGGPINGLDFTLTLLNLFDERYDHPAAASNWQDRLEQDGRAVRLRMDYRF